jgi:Flp pilus assembly protein TadD
MISIELAPWDPDTHRYLGINLGAPDRHGDAEAVLRRPVRLAPRDPRVHQNLGVALDNQECYEEAEAAFLTAIVLAPADPCAYHNLGVNLYQQGRRGDADAAFLRATELAPENRGHRDADISHRPARSSSAAGRVGPDDQIWRLFRGARWGPAIERRPHDLGLGGVLHHAVRRGCIAPRSRGSCG